MPNPPVITLTTDFGLADPYVGAMKGVILAINPHAVLIDISHQVQPQAVAEGAFLLDCAAPYFPEGTIHVAVVDPGVGTGRRALALRTPAAIFVGPDNGILSPALPEHLRAQAPPPVSPVPLPGGYEAVVLENRRYFREPVSATFHGRDIFAPVAAHLSLGLPLSELGPPAPSIQVMPPFRAVQQADGSLRGRVLHIDRFGNLITDVRGEDLGSRSLLVEVAGRIIKGLSRTYGEGEGLIAYVGSLGYLEVALVGGSAAAVLKVSIGLAVSVRPAP